MKLIPTSALYYKGQYAYREALYITYRSPYAQSECFARQAVYTDQEKLYLNFTIEHPLEGDELFLRLNTDLEDTHLLTHDSINWLYGVESGKAEKRVASTRDLGAMAVPAVYAAALATKECNKNKASECTGLIIE